MLNRVAQALESQKDIIMGQWIQGVHASKLSAQCQDVVLRLGDLLYSDLVSTVRDGRSPNPQPYREAVEACPLSSLQDVFETVRLLRDLEDRLWEYLPSQLRETDLPLVRYLAALDQAAFTSMISVFAAMHEAWSARLQTLATTDTLTGCLSRGQLETELKEEWERANRYGRPFSLLMVDVDNMKAVNDRYGHQVGDALLREVAQFIRGTVREVDIVGRYGGDEFLILKTETPPEGAAALARRLIGRLVELHPPITLPGPVTFSIGMTDSSQGFESLPAMIEAADRAMYLAKSAGGDAYSDGRAVHRGAELRQAPPAEHVELETLAEPAELSRQLREELAALRKQREELSKLITSLMERLGAARP